MSGIRACSGFHALTIQVSVSHKRQRASVPTPVSGAGAAGAGASSTRDATPAEAVVSACDELVSRDSKRTAVRGISRRIVATHYGHKVSRPHW